MLARAEHLAPGRTGEDALAFIRYLASQSHLQEIHFLWRPYLSDPGDDMILELALAARCRYVVTHNIRHFVGCQKVGIKPITPGALLRLLKEDVKS